MKLCFTMVIVCFLAAPALAQDSKAVPKPSERTIILDISMIEVNLTRTEDMEKAARDKGQLNSLIVAGKARPIASLQLRARSGESSSARIGQRTPIQTGSLPALVAPPDRQRRIGNQQSGTDTNALASDAFSVVGVPQIQYENTGLSVDALPRLVGDQIELKLHFEMTGLETSTGKLTPTFIQRSFNDVVRLKEGETALLLGIVQHEALWPSLALPSAGQPAGQSRGSFVVLLSARSIE
jgi:type II/III secretion system protein